MLTYILHIFLILGYMYALTHTINMHSDVLHIH